MSKSFVLNYNYGLVHLQKKEMPHLVEYLK